MTEEIWRPVVGYEGLYEVSSYGRVKSVDRYVKTCYEAYKLQKGKILSLVKDKDGYLRVFLFCNGKGHRKFAHRLVAQAFIQNPNNFPIINHKDEDKTNNSVDNLEWCDSKYNNTYGTRKDKVRESKLKSGYWTGLSRKEYRKKYYQENKDKKREYQHQYYQENKEKIREYKHQYYLKRKAGL